MTTDFPAAYARIQSATRAQTQVEIAAALGIRQSSISDAKRRGDIPDGWLITLLEGYAVNPTWIKTGEGPQYLEGTDAGPVDGTRINWAELDRKVEDLLNVARSNITCALRAAMGKEMGT